MNGPDISKLPILTDIVLPEPEAEAKLQEMLVQRLPNLVRAALQEVQPQLEQQLLDALMPRLLASLASDQTNQTAPLPLGGPRLP